MKKMFANRSTWVLLMLAFLGLSLQTYARIESKNTLVTAEGAVGISGLLDAACSYYLVPTAANDEACTATAIGCGDTIVQSLSDATASMDDSCFGSGTADVWFSFTSDGSKLLTIKEGELLFDGVVQLFEGDDCGNLTEVGACRDSPENFIVSEAGNYYFRIRPYDSTANEGTITVILTCDDVLYAPKEVGFTFTMYPNPAGDSESLTLSSKNGIDRYEVLDITGVVIDAKTNPNQGDIKIALSNYSAGLYILRVYSGSDFSTRKMIVR